VVQDSTLLRAIEFDTTCGFTFLRVVVKYQETGTQASAQGVQLFGPSGSLVVMEGEESRIHDRAVLQPVELAPLILEEVQRWGHVGFTRIGSLGRIRL
jgi:hypothetical protein